MRSLNLSKRAPYWCSIWSSRDRHLCERGAEVVQIGALLLPSLCAGDRFQRCFKGTNGCGEACGRLSLYAERTSSFGAHRRCKAPQAADSAKPIPIGGESLKPRAFGFSTSGEGWRDAGARSGTASGGHVAGSLLAREPDVTRCAVSRPRAARAAPQRPAPIPSLPKGRDALRPESTKQLLGSRRIAEGPKPVSGRQPCSRLGPLIQALGLVPHAGVPSSQPPEPASKVWVRVRFHCTGREGWPPVAFCSAAIRREYF